MRSKIQNATDLQPWGEDLRHVVVIPDGNRRWARSRNLPSFLGHKKGAVVATKIFEKSVELGIRLFAFWTTSLDNIQKHSREEAAFLFRLFGDYFRELLDNQKLTENRVRVRAIGRWQETFPNNLKEAIEAVLEKTKNYNCLNLTLLLAYSGKDEIANAIQKIIKSTTKNEEMGLDKLIKENLWTNELPPVDLVIRTGGEPHWSSGFMMWDVADASLYFTETLWPDFGSEEFEKIIRATEKIERRFGK